MEPVHNFTSIRDSEFNGSKDQDTLEKVLAAVIAHTLRD
jgi:hypothetical protein